MIEAKSLIKQINCSVSLLNVFDLHEIYEYNWKKFGIKTTFMNIVRVPKYLSIRNLEQKDKDMLIKKYEDIDVGQYIKNELLLKKSHSLDVMRNYCDKLSKHRNFDWRELWHDRF